MGGRRSDRLRNRHQHPSGDTFSAVVVVVLGGNPNLGSLLEIRLLSNDGAAGRVAFDNVELDADLTGSPVPEPTTAVLFGLGIMGLTYAGRPVEQAG